MLGEAAASAEESADRAALDLRPAGATMAAREEASMDRFTARLGLGLALGGMVLLSAPERVEAG